MDTEELKRGISKLIDEWEGTPAVEGEILSGEPENIPEPDEAPDRVLPEGKRVVRTKSSGDRVYCLDEEKKTRQWVTNPEILKGLGFEPSDVQEVEDNELLKYQMGTALYKLDA